ncbi:MAG: polysaccharide pyruvyl transferase family protein [Phycisphaerales bacterium]|nr:polysaccharide pyruvyl transferase family protein [Phycisphaerales bacterium]
MSEVRDNSNQHASAETVDVTLAGSFGFGNAGDEAVPLAMSDLLDGYTPRVRFRTITRYDQPDCASTIGLGPADAERRRSLEGHPMFFIGGGIVEPRANAVLFRCLRGTRASAPSDIALFGANVEAGVSFNWRWKRAVRRALAPARALHVRDEESRAALAELLPARSIEVLGDVVLAMRPDIVVPSSVAGLGRFIAVTLAPRWSRAPGWRTWIAHQLVGLSRHLDADIIFVPMSVCHDDDRTEHAAVAPEIRKINGDIAVHELLDDHCPRTLSAIFAASSLVVGMRLHTCVMAVAQNVPTLMLAYHPKVAGFARTVGLERFCLPAARPARQHDDTYGYRFEDTDLIDTDLRAIADEALEHTCFRRVIELRERMVARFVDTMRECGVTLRAPAHTEVSV